MSLRWSRVSAIGRNDLRLLGTDLSFIVVMTIAPPFFMAFSRESFGLALQLQHPDQDISGSALDVSQLPKHIDYIFRVPVSQRLQDSSAFFISERKAHKDPGHFAVLPFLLSARNQSLFLSVHNAVLSSPP